MPYDVALLDLNMPDVDGLELARMIRDRPGLRGIRLISLAPTGSRSEVPEVTTFNGLVSKPVRASRLYEEIQAVLTGESAAARLPQRSRSADAGAHHGGIPDVLVVEDTLVNQAVAVRMLEKCGFRAHVAANGREALEVLSHRPYAAVLMDCQMPELDGYETTREIRLRENGGPRIPIIAMTANAMKASASTALPPVWMTT